MHLTQKYRKSIFFLHFFRLPDDIWLIDLDSNKLSPPTGAHDEIPALPEPEGTILKNHLKQVVNYKGLYELLLFILISKGFRILFRFYFQIQSICKPQSALMR